jgi:hypothetical protein
MGIEPTFSAWEADVLPLNYTRVDEPEFYCIAAASQRRSQGGGRGSHYAMGARPQGPGGLIGGLPEIADPLPCAKVAPIGGDVGCLPAEVDSAGSSLPPGRSAPGADV